MSDNPSAGALKAEKYIRASWRNWAVSRIPQNDLAEIIERETGLGELLEAAEKIIGDAEAGMMDEFGPHAFIEIPNRMLMKLREAISKAKGEIS